MSINLTPQVEQRIRDLIENGPYPDADAVVDKALQALEEQEHAKFLKLRQLVRAGFESGNLREFTPELEDEIARAFGDGTRHGRRIGLSGVRARWPGGDRSFIWMRGVGTM
jgi:putative addiction module CopG family antidote